MLVSEASMFQFLDPRAPFPGSTFGFNRSWGVRSAGVALIWRLELRIYDIQLRL